MVAIQSLLDDIAARISEGENKKDFVLLYKANADKEASVDEFHLECDAKGPTLTVLHGKYNTFFGGYTSKDWSSNRNRKVQDKDAFLFSKNQRDGAECFFLPVKKGKVALTCDAKFGPTFGEVGAFANFDLQAFKKDAKPDSVTKEGYMHLNGSLNVNCSYSVTTGQEKIKTRDINSGQMIVKRIEVYQVVDDVLPDNWLPKLEGQEFSEKKEKLIKMEPIPGIDVKWYNILLVGVIGSGKSSFVNTLSTVFSGRVAQIAPARYSEGSVTNKVKAYVLKSENGDPLHIRILDIRGFEDERGYDHELELLLDGKLPIGYQFPDKPEHAPAKQDTKPTLEEEIHLVCFVNGNLNVDTYTERVREHFSHIKQTIAKKGLPMVVIATKFDQLCSKIEKDVDRIYASLRAKDTASKIATFYGVPLNHVFPVVNYVSENKTKDGLDRLALNALYHMYQSVEDYLGNHHDRVDKPDDWTERETLLPSMRNNNEKDTVLRTIHERITELKDKKLLILVVGPTASGKSSFIDSVSSALQDDIDIKAVGACMASAQPDDVSSTETFQLYPMKYKHEPGPLTKSNVNFGDTPGFQEKEGISVDHVKFILKGHVPDKYNIINGIQATDKDFKAHPTPGDKMHCVCFVFDCVTILKGLSKKRKEDIQRLLQIITAEGIPFITILTKCDAESKTVRANKRRVFEDRKVRECKNRLLEMFGFKQKKIFPVINYTQENTVDLQADALLIAAFNEVLKIGKDKLAEIEDEGNGRHNEHKNSGNSRSLESNQTKM